MVGRNCRGGAAHSGWNVNISYARVRFYNNVNLGVGGQGGAVYLDNSNTITMTDVAIVNNTAQMDGGGLFFSHTTYVGLTGVQFVANRALAGSGGGVAIASGCAFFAFGGTPPMLETCGSYVNTPSLDVATMNKMVTGRAGAVTLGYYVIFPATAQQLGMLYCADHAYVGRYR